MGVRFDGLITPHKPGAAIAKYRFVVHGTNDYEVIQASGHDTPIIGVSTRKAVAATDPQVDIVRSGVAEIEYGAAVARGDPVTSDAAGKAVKSAPGAGEEEWIGGIAEVSGVSGDIGSVMLAQSQINR